MVKTLLGLTSASLRYLSNSGRAGRQMIIKIATEEIFHSLGLINVSSDAPV